MAERPIALVLRHGEASDNAQGIFRSWRDVPLTERGVAQAHLAADFIQNYPVTEIISSPLLRAFVTADIAAAKMGLRVFQHRGLFPWRLGIFSGLARKENQDALHLFVENPGISIPEGESLENFEARQFSFWSASLKMSRDRGMILFVCHNSVVTALVNLTLGARQVEAIAGENVKPGGVAEIYWDGKTHFVKPVYGTAETAQFGGS
jgi:broad specificity phosphatase PhoE